MSTNQKRLSLAGDSSSRLAHTPWKEVSFQQPARTLLPADHGRPHPPEAHPARASMNANQRTPQHSPNVQSSHWPLRA